jgi:2-polyprenyl-3-methyl-5-hydroxy-6-metoxy-1,4-benzoquinol methylase
MSERALALFAEIARLNPRQEPFIQSSVALLNDEERESLCKYIDFLVTHEKLDLPYIASCYDTIVNDTLREQIYFTRHKKYRYSTYAEVAGSVYLNDDYMTRYMYGLAITGFLWPQHTQLKRWFLKQLPVDRTGNYLEIGPGHGYYFLAAQKLTAYSYFLGVDISPTSIRLTRSILDSGYSAGRRDYELRQANFLECDFDRQFDAVVMGEVLEHVEKPERFIERIRAVSRPGAFIYLTTAINAPAVDHIQLFSSVESVHDCVRAGGLNVKESFAISANPKLTLEDALKMLQPVNIAVVLEHA